MSAHTPGPWGIVINDGPIIFSGKEGQPVAMCHIQKTSAERLANARLIASAPDLIEALEGLASCDFGATGWNETMERHAINARAAIAKAKGETK